MNSSKSSRVLNLLEPLAFASFVAFYIWRLQTTNTDSWWIFPIWLLASFLLHRDTPKTLGWRADNFLAASRRAGLFFAILIAAICFAGLSLGALHHLPVHVIDGHRFWSYCAFCLLQQVALNSFVNNRLLAAFGSAFPAALASGLIFAALHWPNPVLVPLTFIGGTAMAWLFATERNILPLTLGQTILGALVWWAFPIAWHHSMRVGPGYYTFHL